MTYMSNTQKTVIFRGMGGWFDSTEPLPNTYYPTRREAREARRSRLGLPVRNKRNVSGNRIVPGVHTPKPPRKDDDGFTSLQRKVFNRMTQLQGVNPDEARTVILNNGYNKAASYGHMRAAGANDNEAQFVIALDDPSVSLTYGGLREAGYNHTDALSGALRQTQVTIVGV